MGKFQSKNSHFAESTAAFNNTSLMQSLPTLIKENLTKREEWDYDIFELERLSSHRLVVKFQIPVGLPNYLFNVNR